ncbi:MAG TPA: glycoside hydrolase family 18 protein [Acidimicrobiales bacterium]|nr:glycoside hydrolase family 18 protein [Acidimicrobiales bacterium]
MTPRRRKGIAIAASVGLVGVLVLLGVVATAGKSPRVTTTSPPTIPTTTNPYAAEEARTVLAAVKDVNATLPTAPGSPAPVLAHRPYRRPLGKHEVVGFVPYYELGSIGNTNLAAFTDLVYYALVVRDNGALVENGSSGGWTALEDGGAGDLVAAGHADGDRVLLSVFAESQSVLGSLSARPLGTGRRLADQLAPLLSQLAFDGVDLDLEGQDASDRGGFVAFVAAFSARLRSLDRHWTIMLNTLPQSAEDTTGFFDVAALAPSVNDLFVMAYDMDNTDIPSADAPLTGAALSDVIALVTYSAAGLADKTILGMPFYGYDFPAQSSSVGAQAIGQPYAVTYDQIAASIADDGHKPLWDPVTDTPYTVFRRSGRWHQTWFDDPTSIALKTALAAQFHILGVGAWELGMVQDEPEMIKVLTGGSAVVKLPLATAP